MPKGIYDSTRTGDPYIDGILSGWHWPLRTSLTYGFPDSRSVYPLTYGSAEPLLDFAPVSETTKQAYAGFIDGESTPGLGWMTLTPVEGFANLDFMRAVSPSFSTDVLIARSSVPQTAHAYYPGTTDTFGNAIEGDVWFGYSYDFHYTNPLVGTYGYYIAMHEFGHALGLKHGHENSGADDVVLPLDKDFEEYSVMTYNYAPAVDPGSFFAASLEDLGFNHAQTFMMIDIRALQTIYGANYNFRNGDSVYHWSPASGEVFVNGVSQGRSGSGIAVSAATNLILQTIWDGGGEDTYDLSNYTTDLSLNLAPGGYSTFSNTQRARLGYSDVEYYARGNVYNALLFNDDPRSLIENAKGGSGDDTIRGNQVANRLYGNEGNDTLTGGAGDDYLYGGAGANQIVYSGNKADYVVTTNADGSLTVTDTFADRDGTDTVRNVRLIAFADATTLFGSNTAPTAVTISGDTIAEDKTLGSIIGTLSGQDPDGDSLTFRIVSDPGGFFKIEDRKLVLAKKVDFETAKQHTITIEAKDMGGLTLQQDLTINVTNVREGTAPTQITINKSSVAEDLAVGDVVCEVTGYDPDGDPLTYRMDFDGYGFFQLEGNKVILVKPLDYEKQLKHQFVVSAIDPEGLYLQQIFTIDVTNIYEGSAPRDIRLTSSEIAENMTIGHVLGELSAYDPDGDSLTFSLTSNPGDFFAIVDNKIVLAKTLDYETTTSHVIEVTARDTRGLATSQALSISVLDADENATEAPHSLTLSTTHVSEATSAESVVGEFSATDPNGDELEYALISNPGDYFRIDGNKLILAKPLDYEQRTQQTVTVKAFDPSGHWVTRTFTLQVDDVADGSPRTLSLSNHLVTENIAPGTVVGTVSPSDGAADITFALSDDSQGAFRLVGNKIMTNKAVDYETLRAYMIVVTWSDTLGASGQQSFKLQVQDVYEPTPLVLFGTKYNNALSGDVLDDRLYGGFGNDRLYGKSGRDIFVFDSKLNARKNVDKIADFNVKDDTIWLSDKVFKKLGKGTDAHPVKVSKKFFTVGERAADKNDHLIYNKKSGALFYDADGNGKGEAIKFATLTKNLKLTHADFFMI